MTPAGIALAHPRYWHVWLFLVPLTLLAAWVPWPVARVVGNRLGDLTWLVLPRRRQITLRNLELCFPEWPAARRRAVARESFRNTGIALFESSRAWWRAPATLARGARLVGYERLQELVAQGRGVLLLGAHYTTLERAGAVMSHFRQIDTIYRPQNNPAMEAFVHWRRQRIYTRQIDRRDVRAIFRALKDGDLVWYTGDQDFGRRHAVFVPFFGVPAATVTAGSRFARANGSPAVSVDFRREPDGGFTMEFTPLDADWPTGDESRDTQAMNAHIEAGIRKAPGQYMWYHRRFKTRPAGAPPVY